MSWIGGNAYPRSLLGNTIAFEQAIANRQGAMSQQDNYSTAKTISIKMKTVIERGFSEVNIA